MLSFHPETAFILLFVNKQNGNYSENNTYYALKDIEILDAQNVNIHNQTILNKSVL